MSVRQPDPDDVLVAPPTAVTVAALPEVLTAEQGAWLLQLPLGRFTAAAVRGEIPSRKIGKTRLFRKATLLGLVQ